MKNNKSTHHTGHTVDHTAPMDTSNTDETKADIREDVKAGYSPYSKEDIKRDVAEAKKGKK